MNTTSTYRHAADTAQGWAQALLDEAPDLETVKGRAATAAHRAGEWAGDATERAGDWISDASDTAVDWLEDASGRALARVPAVAAKRARRRRWWIGSALGLVPLIYFFDPKNGADRRARLRAWVKRSGPATSTSTPSFATQSVNQGTETDTGPRLESPEAGKSEAGKSEAGKS